LLLRLVALLYTWSFDGAYRLLISKGMDFIFQRPKGRSDGQPANDILTRTAEHVLALCSLMKTPATEQSRLL
ncbi:unnamed protein product, partial [Amoebophrya sp. A25]